MGRIVFAAAMSHVLDPDYYGTHCGPRGRQMVRELMALVGEMGGRMAAARPDALMVVADDCTRPWPAPSSKRGWKRTSISRSRGRRRSTTPS